MMVRMTSDVETNIVAVERVKEYAETPNEVSCCFTEWYKLNFDGPISERKVAFHSSKCALSDGVLNSQIIFQPKFDISQGYI